MPKIVEEKGDIKLCWPAMVEPRQIECSAFVYWTPTDKLEFTEWGCTTYNLVQKPTTRSTAGHPTLGMRCHSRGSLELEGFSQSFD